MGLIDKLRPIGKIQKLLADGDYILASLDVIAAPWDVLLQKLSAMADSGGNISNTWAPFQTASGSSHASILEIDPLALGALLKELDDHLNHLREASADMTEWVNDILAGTAAFRVAHHEFIKSHSNSNTLKIVRAAASLARDLRLCRRFLQTVVGPVNIDEQNWLELRFPSDFDFERAHKTFHDLKVVYDQLCVLFGVDSAQIPLSFLRAESGSWIMVLLGDQKILAVLAGGIALLIGGMSAAVVLWWHRHTTEGRIDLNRLKGEAVARMSDLANGHGLQTRESSEKFKESMANVASELLEIVKFDPPVVVNGTVLIQPVSITAENMAISKAEQRALPSPPSA